MKKQKKSGSPGVERGGVVYGERTAAVFRGEGAVKRMSPMEDVFVGMECMGRCYHGANRGNRNPEF